MFPMRLAGIALAAGLLAAPSASGQSPPELIRNHFDSDAPMRPPGFFDLVVLGAPGEAQWKVLADFNPPSAPNQLTQTVLDRSNESVAAALRRNVVLRDGKVSVGLRRDAGQGGLVLRMSGDKDFLLLLVDQRAGEARLKAFRDGKVAELARGTLKAERAWGMLSVEASGPRMTAKWDGQPLLEATDPRPASGRVGLATAGAGAAAFDELVIEPLNLAK